ncbi:hypothetical protein V495_02719 [Pseudogymnoascus sp. VKM F-4514 (FW-929)]|nr:hypothetical protein V495_02719 [Pseudogymnoascus sp. VKM F-4514 (FW-929)]KFY65418.1 hypothetical protein V497_01408 [Pseudogymnoascus sp. VKM F-4516 (FW-969)]
MDPFSLTLSVASLVALVAQTATVTRDYLSAVKNARESIITLVTELEALQTNLSSLEEFLRSDSVKGLAFEQNSVLRSCASACESKLEVLCKKLDKVGDSRTSRYLWPLNEKDHLKTVQELRAFGQWIQFALSVDSCSLLSQTSSDILKILNQQVEGFKALQALEDDTTEILVTVRDQTRLLQDDHNAKKRDDILNWISKSEHDQKHQAVRLPRVKGTGGWLLERKEYVRWRDEAASPSILWCHGIQGSGKTVLTSIVIDDLKNSFSSYGFPVSFLYFDYRYQDQQTPYSMLLSMLRQIVAAMPEIPKSVAEAYEKSQISGSHLLIHELENMVLETVEMIPRAYIVIDALDESDESTCRRSFLQFISRLSQIQAVRLFVTSRECYYDINKFFSTYPQIEIQAHDYDLRRYMYQEIDRAARDDEVDKDFASKIVETVLTRAQGMFLLPILQLRTILNEPTAGDMEDSLTTLSHNLSGAFEETINRIRSLPERRKQLGMRTLMWICHAKCPLKVTDLSDAVSVKLDQTAVSKNHCPSAKMMIECCQGLVTIDPESTIIRFAHYTIQEYLIEHTNTLFSRAEASLAETCLTYLLFDTFKQGPCTDKEAIRSRIKANTFSKYAARYWGVHVQSSETDQVVQRLTLTLLNCHDAAASATQIMQYCKGYRKEYWNEKECYSTTALHTASYFGLENTLRKLLDEGILPIDAKTSIGSTALMKAASRGHVSPVRMLLEKGADKYLENLYGTALHCAAEAGHSNTIKELVHHGMSVGDCEQYYRIPITCTLDHDRVDAFETLVDLGADINVCDKSGLTVFHEVAKKGCVNIMNLILKRQWANIESESKAGLRAIHYAVIRGNTAVLANLLEAGADASAPDSSGNTPLDYANMYSNIEKMSLLMKHGAGVSSKTNSLGAWVYNADGSRAGKVR